MLGHTYNKVKCGVLDNFDRLKNPFLRTGSGLCNYIVSEAIQLYFAFSIDNDIN